MAPRQIPHASAANAAAPPLLAVVGNNNPPAVARPTPQLWHLCSKCGKTFRCRFGLSGHFNAHSSRPRNPKTKRLPENPEAKRLPGNPPAEQGGVTESRAAPPLMKNPTKSALKRDRNRVLNAQFEALDSMYKEEGRARAQALASASGITKEPEQLQGLVSSVRAHFPIPEVSYPRSPRAAAAVAAPRAQLQGPVVLGDSSAGSSSIGPGPKYVAEEAGGGDSSTDPRSPNYWKLTGPVVRVHGPGGLLIYKADVGTASGSGKDVVIID